MIWFRFTRTPTTPDATGLAPTTWNRRPTEVYRNTTLTTIVSASPTQNGADPEDAGPDPVRPALGHRVLDREGAPVAIHEADHDQTHGQRDDERVRPETADQDAVDESDDRGDGSSAVPIAVPMFASASCSDADHDHAPPGSSSPGR